MNIDGITIPEGTCKEDIKKREKIIKDFYSKWISENPEKRVWNEDLQDFIYVKFLSINETYNKASRRAESTAAVFKLTKILQKAKHVEIKPSKKNDKNQKSFDRLYILKYGDVKLIVGNQKSINQKVQYTLSVPTGSTKKATENSG